MKQQIRQQPEVIPSDKWVRVFFAGKAVADSQHPQLLRGGHLPIYYFPEQDVRMDWLIPVGEEDPSIDQGRGPWPEPPAQAKIMSVQVNGHKAENAAWLMKKGEKHPELVDHVAFAWQAMDAWYEEDQQIRFHPHDPYHLIDVRASSRHVKVIVEGETVADTSRPVVLFETGLPPRYYIPKMDVQMDLLEGSNHRTHCAYKGTAAYYTVRTSSNELIKNAAWYYPFPNYQYAPIQNLIAFYERSSIKIEVEASS